MPDQAGALVSGLECLQALGEITLIKQMLAEIARGVGGVIAVLLGALDY